MADFHRYSIFAKSSHHLVWALEVTADSYTRGIIRHRVYTTPLSTLKAYAVWKLKTSPEAPIARLAAELWAVIEGYLMAEADAEGEKAVRAYTWDRKRRSANRRRKRAARGAARNGGGDAVVEGAVMGPAGTTVPGTDEDEEEEEAGESLVLDTSDENDGEDFDVDLSESEGHRNKMDERAVFFADAARKMCFAKWRASEEGPLSPDHAHLQRYFSLSLNVTSRTAFGRRRGPIKSVYICLPWTQQPLIPEGCTGSIELKADHLIRYTNAQTNLSVSTSNLRPPVNTNVHRSSWNSRFDAHTMEVDPEYLVLTQEKVMKLNHAVDVLGLEVVDNLLRGSNGISHSKLRSAPKMISEDEYAAAKWGGGRWINSHRRCPPLHWAEENLFDNRDEPWPKVDKERKEKEGDGTKKLWVPKLLSISQMAINEPDGDVNDHVRKWMEEGSEE